MFGHKEEPTQESSIKYEPPVKEPVKKGNTPWRPATQLATVGRDPNYAYRYVEDTPERIQKMKQEQWEICNRLTDKDAHIDAHEEHDAVTGGMKYREMVLMRMPKSTAKERNAYYQNQATRQERGVAERLQSEISKDGDAEVHGTVTID